MRRVFRTIQFDGHVATRIDTHDQTLGLTRAEYAQDQYNPDDLHSSVVQSMVHGILTARLYNTTGLISIPGADQLRTGA